MQKENKSRKPMPTTKHARVKRKMSRRDKLKRRSGNERMKVLRRARGDWRVPSPSPENPTIRNKTHFLRTQKKTNKKSSFAAV